VVSGFDPSQLVGQVLDSRYRIERLLGQGGMGIVFRARHVRLERWFAIKLLHPRLRSDVKVVRRFAREAELAGKLDHPNVVGVLDISELDGLPYLVMDLAPGKRLSELFAHAPFSRPRAVHVLRQLCEGLDHAHGHGLIHRDLKPDNVIVEHGDLGERVRIIDFGIALLHDEHAANDRITTDGVVLGTPHYMAPELATGRVIDHRIDLFALGVVCFEMLTARMPFSGSGVDVIHANVADPTPAMPGVDPRLEYLTRWLMAKRPEDRPPTAAAARALLDTFPNEPFSVDPPSEQPDKLALGSAQTVAQGR
jgi:serine/threonine protein kinase